MFSPNKMVISGYGVDHDEFVNLVDKNLGDRSNVDKQQALGARFKPRVEQYFGGDFRTHVNDSQSTSILLGFHSSG